MDQASRITPPKVGFWWAKKDAELAIKMFKENATYHTIAIKFGRTRGAVAGLLDRYRKAGEVLPKRGQGMIASLKKKRKQTIKISPQVMINVVQAAPEPIRRVRLRLIESDTEVAFAELKEFHCKWPIGDPRLPDFRFCGCNRLTGKPYCEKHSTSAGRLYGKLVANSITV